MSDYGFWLYSSMTQATAALFGVFGMFIIFKLQLLRDKIKDAEHDIIDSLSRLGRTYEALVRRNPKEIEEILIAEINSLERAETISEDEARRLVIDKGNEKRKLDLLRNSKNSLEIARNNYSKLVGDGKGAMKGLSFIFVFSVALLITKPLLGKVWLIVFTFLYIVSLVFVFKSMWHLIKETLI